MKSIITVFILLFSFAFLISSLQGNTLEEITSHDPWIHVDLNSGSPLARLDHEKLRFHLDISPNVDERIVSPVVIDLLQSNGMKKGFRFYKTSVMHPRLSDRYPEIKSYMGIGTSNPSHRASIVMNGEKVYGFIATEIGNSIFKATGDSNEDLIQITRERDLDSQKSCDVIDTMSHSTRDVNDDVFPECVGVDDPCYPVGSELVTYRFAGIMTEDVNAEVADGTVVGGLAWMVAMVNQVNALWIRDLSFQLQMVEDSDLIIHTSSNPAPSQFKQECPEAGNPRNCELPEVEPYLETIIGPGGWDDDAQAREWEYGACFDIGYGGGLAYCPGPTSVNSPSFGVFSHEIMHNVGSNHNITREDGFRSSIGGNIMYWVTPPATIPGNSGMTYTSHSIEVGMNYRSTLPGNSVPYNYVEGYSTAQTNNIIPELIVPDGGYIIPRDTPFALEGYSSPMHPDYTFSWEQNDASSEQYLNEPSSDEFAYFPSTMGPLFSSVDPTKDGYKRTFPDMSSLLENNYETYDAGYFNTLVMEKLPFSSREINMRLIVRTNDPYSGSVNHKNVQFFVEGSAGPFRVTSQDVSTVWDVNSQQTITWDVANTDDPSSVNCQMVDIVMSLDGGDNFNYILFENIPNSGSHSFVVPPMPSTLSARLMIKSVDNLFFDINNGAIVINNPYVPSVTFSDEIIALSLAQNETQQFSVSFTNDGEENSVLQYYSGNGSSMVFEEDFEGLDLMENTEYVMYELPTGWERSSLGRGWIVGKEDLSAWEDWISAQIGAGYFDIPEWSDGNYIFADDDQYSACSNCADLSECGSINGCADGTQDLLYTPEFNVPVNSRTQLLFDSYFGYVGSGHEIHVGIVTNDISTWNIIHSQTSGTDAFVSHELDLTDYEDETIRIVFHSEETAENGWGAGWALDNIRIAVSPAWLHSQATGLLHAGETNALNFSINTANLDAGSYEGSLVVSDINHDVSDTVKITLDVLLSTKNDPAPLSYSLYQNYPNPFNPETELMFSIAKEEMVTLAIYDILGNRIKTVLQKRLNPGSHRYSWDGLNDNGNTVSAGMYFYKMNTPSFSETKKMLLLK